MSKTIAITGANSGIGKAAARELAKQDQTILLICRNQQRGEEARNDLIKETDNQEIYLYLADLADMDEIETCAVRITDSWDTIDVLINNAGVILTSKELSPQGIEKTFAVNHLGHFLLTDLLYHHLTPDARIINTSSGAHFGGDLNLQDINYQESRYSTFGAYARSKLGNILYTKKLDRILNSQTAYAIHPGFVGSNFAKNNGLLATIVMNLAKPFARSPTRGAQPLIYLASEEDVEMKSGKYFVDSSKLPFTRPNITTKPVKKTCLDETLQDDLWNWSKRQILNWKQNFSFNIE